MYAESSSSFNDLAGTAMGHVPYGYQSRIAAEGLPELLRVPTGAGKTVAAVLPWLYRRRFHPDQSVRDATPGRLVVVLPMRVLVEQTHDLVETWLARLGLTDEVGLHLLMGGEPRRDTAWRMRPDQDVILVGTQDMLLSRALNRGYGASRYVWPVEFGLLNSGTHWVFDEVQLMGPALPTSRQLEGLREKLGTAAPCSSTWMSATVDPAWLETADNKGVTSVVELTEADRSGPLLRRLEATKTVRQVSADKKTYERDLAAELLATHRPGTLTLAILNSVERAQALHKRLSQASVDEPVVLLHSRFRPADRAARYREALAAEAGGGFVVATQVLEAGVDISATTLLVEAASWPSVVQRAGRCNRDGNADGAAMLWVEPPKPEPYPADDVEAAVAALTSLEGQTVTAESLGDLAVEVSAVEHPQLRLRDLVDLFDTAPDLDGNDVDVSRFIRGSDEMDVAVAWRALPKGKPPDEQTQPGRDERCPVPIGEARRALQGERAATAWRLDFVDGQWVRCRAGQVRPGQVLVFDADSGCYDPALGWDRSARGTVVPVDAEPDSTAPDADTTADADPLSAMGRWVSLTDHSLEVEAEVRRLTGVLPVPGLGDTQLDAAAVAGRWHDLGKAHSVFQDALLSTAADEQERDRLRAGGPWAKSQKGRGGRYARRWFRHELASALALLGDPQALAGVAEPDLVAYLVAAHHGRIRLGIRAMPEEKPPGGEPDRLTALGVWDGEPFPAVEVAGTRVAPERLDLSVMAVGSPDGGGSWSERMLALRDRGDLGPFRLGFLEALVRVADWRMSQNHGESR